MRCKQCGSSFRISIWIIQCGECKEHYCTKCMKRLNGICYCEKCVILTARPPDITELMKLKSKDLQDYLNRHNIPTLGLVEKRELVEVLCRRTIPVKSTKTSTVLNKIYSNFESILNLPDRINGERTRSNPTVFASSSQGDLRFHDEQTSSTLPKERRAPPPRPPPPRSRTPPPRPPPEFDQPSASSSPVLQRVPKLADFSSVDDLNKLSPKELKIILTYNRVDYRGCVEKSELLDKVKALWRDMQRYEELPDDAEDLCKLCMDAPLDCVLLECGHIATCINCGKQLAECPICRQYVSRVVRTFKA